MQKQQNNILIMPDLHIPFNHRNALRFLSDIKKEYNCNTIVSIGDFSDQCSLSRFDKDPDAYITRTEFSRAARIAKEFVSEFPKVHCLMGNHDLRIMKRLKDANIPPDMIIPTFNQLWGLPKEWTWNQRIKLNGITYIHGNKCGSYAHINTAKDLRTSVVIGHTHSTGAVQYMSSFDNSIFGMNVGCLIDDNAYAFNYAREMTSRPVLGCGVILDDGKMPMFISMK